MSGFVSLPPQQLSFNRKNKKWRQAHLDWADSKTFFNYDLVRKSVIHKKINYDLLNGIIHMSDVESILNPEGIQAKYISDAIQHYPIMNSKLNVLRGEESKRIFDYKVVVTNPNAISEIENNKKNAMLQSLQQWVSNKSQSEDEANQELQKLSDYFTYEWQDMREVRANALLNHYVKEYNIPLLFNKGFIDAMSVGEEIYQCDIVGGEPIIEKVNPLKLRVFRSGYSNRIEDADMLVLEDYWSPSKIIDTFYDSLTKKDLEYIEKIGTEFSQPTDSLGNIDERFSYIPSFGDDNIDVENLFTGISGFNDTLLPYDLAGNIKVLRVYWKSKRKIKKVKSYDITTGEEVFTFYPETYKINKDLGEEEEIYWINEAWEGTKIGDKIYINIQPRVIQYNRLSNPSRCHFGIIGSIYNLNDDKPFSLVDMMKSYNYLYDAIYDRLNKLLSRTWGNMAKMDLAKVPKGWSIDKWLYYAKAMGLYIEDSFKEGNVGAATGKLAGALNNASSGVISMNDGNMIQEYIQLLEFIKNEMSEVAGISKQREGQIANRETVGGVERATLQSSHITEWLFLTHDDVKKRVLECFLETAKIALKGRSKKFNYILSDGSIKLIDIDGDEFNEADYGLVVDNSNNIQDLNQKIDTLAQAALQNQALSFSSILKVYTTTSMSEKIRAIENSEKQMNEMKQQEQQQQMQIQQQQLEQQSQLEQAKLKQEDMLNQRDNDTKIVIAELQHSLNNTENYSQESKDKLEEQIREFNLTHKLNQDKLELDKQKVYNDKAIKEKQLNNQRYKTNNQ